MGAAKKSIQRPTLTFAILLLQSLNFLTAADRNRAPPRPHDPIVLANLIGDIATELPHCRFLILPR